MPTSRATPEIEAAYLAASYRVGGKLVLRVGEPSRVLDHLLANRGLDEWAYLTAHNPRSRQLTQEENAARQRELLARLAGRRLLLGHAEAPDGAWREASVLVLGMARDEALALARSFEQNAFLAGRRGGVAELVWC